ncbi:MAG: hypothetical protein H7270_14345 [Dermatophilaceae bacterium]|nr:hypothetical protein [Dermatophilaceae bacterium]
MTVQSQQHPGTSRVAAAAVAAGAVVSVALGVYGGQHQPTGQATFTLGLGSMIAMKVWLALAVGVLALVQLVSALWMYGKLGRPAGRAVAITHRLSGTTAILVSLPVAYSCLWSLGFQSYDTRVLVHSLFGCVLYGAFVTKILALRSRTSPGWLLPLAGGLLFSAIVIVVLTSAVWYLNTTGLPTGSTGY